MRATHEDILASVIARLQPVRGPDRRGWYSARCPFHDDHTPSFGFTETGFACQGCDRNGSLAALARELGVDLAPSRSKKRTAATYDYTDEEGTLLHQTVRSANPKGFKQRRPDGRSGWIWSLKGSRVVLYRLPDVLVVSKDEALFVVEGEKDVDRLWAEGLPATTNPMGAGNWRSEFSDSLRGRLVVIIPDNDAPGRAHAAEVARSLHGLAAEVRLLELPDLPERGDVSDWLDAGRTVDELVRLADSADPVEPEPAAKQGAARPTITVTNRRLRDLADDAWAALLDGNDQPRLFTHGGAIAEIRLDDEGRARIVHLSLAGVRGRLDRCADWIRLTDEGNKPARPPKDVVEDLDALPKPLPRLRGVVGAPVFTQGGVLETSAGYQEATGLFYDPAGDPVPPIPDSPDETDLRRAKQILHDWLADFPFADDASRPNALAIGITAVARELIDGTTPLFVIDAPAPGTGKGLLASGMGLLIAGSEPAVMAEPRGDDELRKRITALLCEGTPVALFDNIKRRVASAVLAAVLTAPTWGDRILGRTQQVKLPNRTIWMLTGNNVELDSDIARRTVWIRIDARRDRPWERTSFRHPDLTRWVRRHRHELVWAFLVLVQRWIASGRPGWQGKPLGSYEAWSELVGGVLENADITGFMQNRDDLYRRVDEETEEWRVFTAAWWREYGDTALKTGDLHDLATNCAPSIFEGAKDGASARALNTRLGKALGTRRDRRFADLFIRRAGDDAHNGGALWKLEEAVDDDPSADVDPSDAPTSAQHPQESGPISGSIAEDAEHADVVSASVSFCFPEDGQEEKLDGIAFSHPHVPQHPQTDSNQPDLAADVVRKMPAQSADVPQCKRCGRERELPSSTLCDQCRREALARVMKGQR